MTILFFSPFTLRISICFLSLVNGDCMAIVMSMLSNHGLVSKWLTYWADKRFPKSKYTLFFGYHQSYFKKPYWTSNLPSVIVRFHLFIPLVFLDVCFDVQKNRNLVSQVCINMKGYCVFSFVCFFGISWRLFWCTKNIEI